MRAVVFLRNVNQGQRGHPSTAEILAAFADAGCPDAAPFQSNGTIVVDADDPADVAESVVALLAERTGAEREAFWIPFDDIVTVVDAHSEAPDVRRYEFTLHSGGTVDLEAPATIREAEARRCEIIDAGPGWTLTCNQRDGDGNATPVIERLTEGPASSRALSTLVRLVGRFAEAS